MRISLSLAALACITAAVLMHTSQLEARLLRMDPNSLPTQALMEFARSRGEALFEAHCAACHGARGQADPARGIPDLSDNDWLYGTGSVSDIEQIIKFGIRSHHPKAWNLAIMPAYATARPSIRDDKIPALSPGNIRDLVEFLAREQGRSADAAAAKRGAELFGGVAGCYDCHAADGKGDSSIGAPNLTDRITLYGDGSRESLSMSIAYGRHGMCPAWATRISAAGIREVALFVYSLSHPQDRAAPAAPGAG
ncbi:MAG TPA: c-type cytochrome [Steroidobacteraceae bacterium]|nr:c-type cytochrome [Steroidobacteraceae bacterium]